MIAPLLLLLIASPSFAPTAGATEGKQDAPRPAWRHDVDAARKEARRDGRPCVLLIRSDASAH